MGLLEADSVRKVYGGRVVVKSVSLAVEPGRITGLLGPNGAGKTTTFYMVVGAVRPDGGEIRFDGRDITRLPMHARARLGIGYLAQEASVFRDLTVWDNVLAILEFMGLSRAERLRKTQELLEELSLMHVKDSLGRALSGGERRRAEIARTLAGDPLFILLDEPFAGVDPIAVGEIQRIVAYLRDKGLGILITDHNVRETLSICDHTYVMNAGEILVEGGAEDIISNPQARKIYLGEDFAMTGLQPAAGPIAREGKAPAHATPAPAGEASVPSGKGSLPPSDEAPTGSHPRVVAEAQSPPRSPPPAPRSSPPQPEAPPPAGPRVAAPRPVPEVSEPPPAPPPPPSRDVPPADTGWSPESPGLDAVWPPPPGEPVLRSDYGFGDPDEDEPLGGARLFDPPQPRTRRGRAGSGSRNGEGPEWPDPPDSGGLS